MTDRKSQKLLYCKFHCKHLHVIVDNLAVHKHPKIKDWLA